LEMVAHQAEGMRLTIGLGARLAQRLEEPLPIRVIAENRFAPGPLDSSGGKSPLRIQSAKVVASPNSARMLAGVSIVRTDPVTCQVPPPHPRPRASGKKRGW
jgi:hypothetical protein